MAFEVFNDTDEEFEAATRRKFMLAHSGHQYLCNFNPSPSYGKGSDDWLISPELSGEQQTITFFAKSLANNYRETFEVLYSATDDNPTSFTNIETFPDVVGGLTWTEYNIQLPAGAKYFAIHVVSYDCLGLQVDDVTYRKASLVVKSYNVYRDGILVGNTQDTHFTDTAEPGNHVYQVSVVYTVGESLRSQEASVITTTTIAGVNGGKTTIAAQSGAIVVRGAEGKQIAVYMLDGRRVAATTGASMTTIHVNAGVYVVKVDNQVVNITVK
jgi:hypothetical protein